jgi:hypothetical protein
MSKGIIGFVFTLFILQLNGQVVINEVKNHCSTTFGCDEKGNWIELYNQGDETVQRMFYLTDDKQNLKKWKVSNGLTDICSLTPKGFFVIGINEESNYSKAQVVFSKQLGDTLYLVQLQGDKLVLLDQVVRSETLVSDSVSSTGLIGNNWQKNLNPTPLEKNKEKVITKSKKRMELFLVPLGFSSISLSNNPGQKNKPIYSFGAGFYRTRRFFRIFDLQYGVSVYRIGYNASYVTTDYFGTKKRDRTSTLKSRGIRTAFETKLGLPITPRFTLFSGFELGFINQEKIKTHTELLITYEDGTTKSNVIETEASGSLSSSYLLGFVLEAEYYWKKNIAFSLKYTSRKEYGEKTEILAKQWNVLLGAKWRFWSGKKQVTQWSIVR